MLSKGLTVEVISQTVNYICVTAAASGTEYSVKMATSNPVVDLLFTCGPWILMSCVTNPNPVISGGLHLMWPKGGSCSALYSNPLLYLGTPVP